MKKTYITAIKKDVNNPSPEGETPAQGISVTIKTDQGALASIYSDNNKTVKANPLTTDSNGQAWFYAENGVYTYEYDLPSGTRVEEGNLIFDPDDQVGIGLQTLNNPLCEVNFGVNGITGSYAGAINFTRAGNATYWDIYGNLQTAAVNELRIEKDGALIEGASTNYLLNYDSPATQTVTMPAGSYTLSVYGSGSASTPDGTATEGSPLTSTTDGSPFQVTVTGTLDYFQIEPKIHETSLIPTTTAPATRPSDDLLIQFENNHPLFNSSNTLVMDYLYWFNVNGNAESCTVFDIGNNLALDLFVNRQSNSVSSKYFVSGISSSQLTTVNYPQKLVAARVIDWGARTHKGVNNGVGGNIQDISSGVPADVIGANFLYLGRNQFNAQQHARIHIKSLRIYDITLTDSQLSMLAGY